MNYIYLEFLDELQEKLEKDTPKNADIAEITKCINTAKKLANFDGDFRNVFSGSAYHTANFLAGYSKLTPSDFRSAVSRLVVYTHILVFFQTH